MTSTPLVSIVCGYYNRENYVDTSIKTLINQTYKNLEILIFDDCSTDQTLAKLEELESSDDRIRIIRHQVNKGFVKGLTAAINLASGKYIAIHGSGDISYPTRIEEQVNILEAREEIGVVGCFVENIYSSKGSEEIRLWKKTVNGDARNLLLEENPFTHGEVMYRKSIYDQVGGYRDLFTFSQDFDLWCRMSLHCHFYTIERVLYRRHLLADGASVRFDKKILQQTLREFGIQNHELRLAGKEDLLDNYGYQSMLFFQFTKRYLRRITPILFQALKQTDIANSPIEKVYFFVRNLYLKNSRRIVVKLLYALYFVFPRPLSLLLISKRPFAAMIEKMLR